jgi:HEAT repeat protein
MAAIQFALIIFWGLFNSDPALARIVDDPFEQLQEAEEDRLVGDPLLLQSTESENPGLRARGAEVFGRLRMPEGIDSLFALLKDQKKSVRIKAAFALGQLGWQAESSNGRESEIVQNLLIASKDGDAAVRRAAVEALGKVALADAPGTLILALQDPNSSVRAEALLALFRARYAQTYRNPQTQVPALEKEAMAAVLAQGSDQNAEVRRNLAYLLFRLGDTRGLSLLIQLSLHQESRWTRYFAASGLGKFNDPNAIQAAVRAAGDRAKEVRLAAIESLIRLKQPGLIPASAVRDPWWHIRAAVARAQGSSKVASHPTSGES